MASLMEEPTVITRPTDYAYIYQRSEFFNGSRWRQNGACSALADHTRIWFIFAEPVINRIPLINKIWDQRLLHLTGSYWRLWYKAATAIV